METLRTLVAFDPALALMVSIGGTLLLVALGRAFVRSRRDRDTVAMLTPDRLARLRAARASTCPPVPKLADAPAAAPAPMPAYRRLRPMAAIRPFPAIRKVEGRPCRWRRGRHRTGTRLVIWTCDICGVSAYCMERSAPRDCKRALRTAAL